MAGTDVGGESGVTMVYVGISRDGEERAVR